MKNEPKLFKLLSLIFLVVGLAYPFWSFNGESVQLGFKALEMSLTDGLLMLSFLSLSISFYYSWVGTHILYMTNIFFVVINFITSLSDVKFHNSVAPLVVGIFYYSLYLIFTQSEEFKVLVNKKKQWWKTAPRIPVSIDSVLYVGRDQIKLTTVDISETGVLLKMDNPNAFKKYHDLLGKEVKLELALDGQNIHLTNASVVRLNLANKGSKGVALNFVKKSQEFNYNLISFLNSAQNIIREDVEALSRKVESQLM